MNTKTGNSSHPAIGLLIEGITGPYQSGIWPGMVESAREEGVRLLCYCGGALEVSPQNPWEYQRNSLFDIAEKDRLDGYIISGSLGGFISRDRFIEFVDRFRDRPLISLIPILESIPAVYVDNHKGMYDLMTHLIHDHHYCSFAFIRGPEGNYEAEERFLLFKELLQHHDIAFDPETIIQGNFTRESGKKAVDYLFDRKLHVDAIIASADEIAIGALHALREKGMRIPGDVALVGFDDIPESAVSFPPLTTIRQPMHALGKKAVAMIAGLLRGDKIPSTAVLETTLKIRRSCGCFSHALPTEHITAPRTPENNPNPKDENGPDIQEIISRADPAIRDHAVAIIESFLHDVNSSQSDSFLKAVDTIAGEPAIAEKSEEWNALFLELWLFAFNRWEHEKFVFAAALLDTCSKIRVELQKRVQDFRLISVLRENKAVRSVGQSIVSALEMDLLLDTLARRFPAVGITTFFLMLYDHSGETGAKLCYRLSCVNGERITTAPAYDFCASLLAGLPSDSDPKRPAVLVIEPLYFQKERFGILAYGADSGAGELYEILSEYISSALHLAYLINKVKHQATVLDTANKELSRLQAQEHTYLETINRELAQGRNIQKGFLPQVLPRPEGWEVAALFVPARAVSGDFYDPFMLGEKYMIMAIADVSGKGVGAALFMALVCTLIRIFTERLFTEGADPLNAVGIINDYVFEHYSQAKDRQMYTTLFIGLLDVTSGVMRYCNAGHYSPVVVASGAIHENLGRTGPALGLIPSAEFKKDTVDILPDTFLFAYTDGVIDARNPDGGQFTTKRLFAIVQQKAATAFEKLSQVESALSAHISEAEPSDDITILIVRRQEMAFTPS